MAEKGISRKVIQEVLDAGVQAPSGENCQPWRFVVRGNRIDVFNVPERDLSLYNFKQRGSFIAHGALLENIFIALSNAGLKGTITLFPDEDNITHTATVTATESTDVPNSLFPHIYKRSSNRKPYKKIPLSSSQRVGLLENAKLVEAGELRLEEDPHKIVLLGKALSYSDRLLFENKKIHDFLFGHISWDRKEAIEKKSGFYIKELELPSPVETIFRVLRNWKIASIFNKIGFSVLAAKSNAKLYSRSSAIGIIVAKGNQPKDFVNVGRLMQRVWLEATRMDLSLQPTTGIAFFMQRVLGGEAQEFSANQIENIKQSYQTIADTFNIKKETIAMLFRIGDGGMPTTKSLRLQPIIDFED